MKKVKKSIKRKIKDSIFTNLFKEKRNAIALYKAIHPKDKDVKESDIEHITLSTVFTDGLYNDFGIIIKNKIIFLLEAQSTWSVNILFRYLSYLGETYKKYFKERSIDLYSAKKIEAPIPEVYVLYTGDKKVNRKYISLNKEFFNETSPIDIQVKIITDEKKQNILREYIEFTKIADKIRKDKKENKAKRLYSYCVKNNILKDYVEKHGEEFMSTMDFLYDQEYVTKVHEEALARDSFNKGIEVGEKQGIQQGIQQGMKQGVQQENTELLKKLVAAGLLTHKQAKIYTK